MQNVLYCGIGHVNFLSGSLFGLYTKFRIGSLKMKFNNPYSTGIP